VVLAAQAAAVAAVAAQVAIDYLPRQVFRLQQIIL
jgi:hypothetical protein